MSMLSAKDMGIVYETLLLSPGMNDTVKIALNLSRKNVLLLAKVIELGLTQQGGEQSIITVSGKETITELSALPNELLSKAGLQEMNNKLAALSVK